MTHLKVTCDWSVKLDKQEIHVCWFIYK